MKKIVTVPASKLLKPINNVILSVPIITELKKAGVPVIGDISILGVEWGSLKIERVGTEMIYTFEGNPPKPATTTVAFDEEDDEL